VLALVVDIPQDLTALGAFVTACAAAYSIIRNGSRIKKMDEKVATANGRSLGVLAELNEGRRIRRDIPPEQRTVREQAYVNLLEQIERDGSTHERDEDQTLKEAGQQGQGPADAPDKPYP
jgi:hypothetical protein